MSDFGGLEGINTPEPEKKDNTLRNLILVIVGVAGAAALCCCLVVGAVVLTGGAALGGLFGEIVSGPYDVMARPMPPSGAGQSELLPANVGPYRRAEASGGSAGDGMSATYQSQQGQIRVQVRLYASENAAMDAVQDAKREMEYEHGDGFNTRISSAIPGRSVALLKTGSYARMAWQRGAWVFDVSGQVDSETFDAFMETYPY